MKKIKNKKINITVILTCFNRKEKTIKCIRTLYENSENVELNFIVVDDNSTDGTLELLKSLEYNICILNGNGNLYWSGGMRVAIDKYIKNGEKSEYVLLINDDVEFNENVIEKLINRSKIYNDAIVVGATCDDSGNFTYGALKLTQKRKKGLYDKVYPNSKIELCDTFNANCVLIKDYILREVGNFDSVYKHSLADLDYGFMISKKGYKIISSDDYIGICYRNSLNNTWRDKSLGVLERIKLKESIKGSPFKEWFYFMKKNFGFILAFRYSITPYIRIILKK